MSNYNFTSAHERFEYLAELFYNKTGMLAPGKDSPAAFGGSDNYEERLRAFEAFCNELYSEVFEMYYVAKEGETT